MFSAAFKFKTIPSLIFAIVGQRPLCYKALVRNASQSRCNEAYNPVPKKIQMLHRSQGIEMIQTTQTNLSA